MVIKKEVIIENSSGLHARPAAKFVQTANKFKSDITIIKDDQEVNGKSIMGLLMLAAEKGARITIIVDGEDAKDALEELEGVLGSEMEDLPAEQEKLDNEEN
jgi:phosphocarrier protein HPr